MSAPIQQVTLTPAQVEDLRAKLADLRHNIANQLSLIVAATELMHRRPEAAARFVESLDGPPRKITQEVRQFSDALEKALTPPSSHESS
jgi:hypothetical protein